MESIATSAEGTAIPSQSRRKLVEIRFPDKETACIKQALHHWRGLPRNVRESRTRRTRGVTLHINIVLHREGNPVQGKIFSLSTPPLQKFCLSAQLLGRYEKNPNRAIAASRKAT